MGGGIFVIRVLVLKDTVYEFYADAPVMTAKLDELHTSLRELLLKVALEDGKEP